MGNKVRVSHSAIWNGELLVSTCHIIVQKNKMIILLETNDKCKNN
jgi:hypothetical protein